MIRPVGITVFCSHPKGFIPTCRCGANVSCPDCGYGRGSAPCDCSREDAKVKEVVGVYKERFADAWKALA
jgi:hypothetical protein